MSGRVCILHVGTHKTGTTSLQVALQQNAAAFGAAGFLIAQSGRHGALPGNHELAWELLGGTSGPHFSRLLEELRAATYRTALLSSEDFSLLYARSDVLLDVASALRSIGCDPKIILYLRAQAPYAESMYVERIKHGYVRPLQTFLETILATGHYLPDGTQQNLQFEYTGLIEPFARAFGADGLRVRAYIPNPDPAAIFHDFLAAIAGFDPELSRSGLQLQISRPRENESLTFGALLRTLHDALRPGVAFAPELPAELAFRRFALLQRSEYERLLQRFEQDNRTIAQRYGAAIPFVEASDIPAESDPIWEKARHERIVFDRCMREWTPATDPIHK